MTGILVPEEPPLSLSFWNSPMFLPAVGTLVVIEDTPGNHCVFLGIFSVWSLLSRAVYPQANRKPPRAL